MKRSLLVVDDHPMIRQGLASLVATSEKLARLRAGVD
jgi:DNA-binding NarL/FixJ family response regulator